MTPQELVVSGELSEIYGEKIVLCSTAEKKNCLLLIRSEKNCTFKLAVEKNVVTQRKTIWSAPNFTLNMGKGILVYLNIHQPTVVIALFPRFVEEDVSCMSHTISLSLFEA